MRSLPNLGPDVLAGYGSVSLAATGDGRILVTNLVEGDLRLDCEAPPPSGVRDVLVTEFDSGGNVVRVRRLGAPGISLRAAFIDVDREDRSYLLALTEQGTGTIELDGVATSAGILIASFDADGTLRWAHGYPQDWYGGSPGPLSFDVSPAGEVTLAIQFQGPLTLGDLTLYGGLDDDSRGALATWAPDGSLRRFGYFAEGEAVYSMAYAENGDLAVVSGSAIEVLTPAGETRWQSVLAEAEIEMTPTFIGSELITSPWPLGSVPGPWLRSRDAATGDLAWQRGLVSWAGADGDWPPYASSIVPTSSGLALAAPLLGSVDFGLGTFQSNGEFDALIIFTTRTGEPIEGFRIGAGYLDVVYGMVTLADGRIGILMGSETQLDLGFGLAPPKCEPPCFHQTLAVIPPP